jgi:hypothetical protein
MKLGKELKPKDLDKDSITRRIRLKRFHAKMYAWRRSHTLQSHVPKKKGALLLSFFGNWSGGGKYIHGHSRRSTKPFVARMESVKVDKIFVVDKFKSTITCSSCFGVTSKQTVRLNESFKTIKGAVVCKNTNCPRRLAFRSTTINRVYNGANNIGLIGFSSVVSDDGMPIAPFQRISYKSNKYVK